MIVNWNGIRFLPPLLRSIHNEEPAQILVIDNASFDGSLEYLRTQTGIRTIENLENIGFGAAANQGIKESNTPYILLLNVDTQAMHGSIEKLEAFLNRNAKAGIVAPQLLFTDGTVQPSCRNLPTVWNYSLFLSYLDRLIPAGYRIGKKKHERMMKVEQPMGAVLMIRKSALDTTGFFDPLFTLYMEEIDLCKRMKENGWEIYYLPEAKFIHHAGGSTNQDWERSQKEYFTNVMRYFQKHFPEKSLSSVKYPLSAALILRSFVLVLAGRFRESKFYFNQAFRL
ncbi:MAG: glycosyltransferase family 2 protein [Acidobacteriota bacterium]